MVTGGTASDADRAGREDQASPAVPDTPIRDRVIFTIGHSTRSQAEFIELLTHYGVVTLADVRTMPRSRHNPQFNRDVLSDVLPEAGIAYVHIAALGGLRHGLGAASPNLGWRNRSFRGYADYMQTPEFVAGLEQLLDLAQAGPVAVMCAEAVPWRCHRSLIADALLVRGLDTADIQSLSTTLPHKLTPFAHVEGNRITYPAIEEEDPAPVASNMRLFDDSPAPGAENQLPGKPHER